MGISVVKFFLLLSAMSAPVMSQTVASAIPASQAPILWDSFEQVITIERDGTATTTTEQVVRPITPAGVQGLAAIPFPVSKSLQRFQLLESWVLSPDGKKTPLDAKTIMTQSSPWTLQAPTLSDIEMQVLPIPQLGVGGMLRIAARMSQTTPHFPGNGFFAAFDVPWIQRTASTVTFSTPADLPLFIENSGWTAQPERREGDRLVRRFTRTPLPFAMPDRRSTSPIDWAPRLFVTTFADWASFARAYQDRATPREAASPEIRALAAELTKGVSTEKDKVVAITRWVRDNIRYVNIILDVGGFVPAPATDVLAKRFGDCKGHVTLAMALLGAAGIDATPALVSLEPTYKEPSVALPIFNHVVVHVPSLGMFIDTTARNSEPGEIPDQLGGKFTLLTRTGKTMRIPLRGEEPTATTVSDEMTIAADGTISGTSRINVTGSNRADMRATLETLASADREQFASSRLTGNGSPGNGTVSASKDGKGLEGTYKLSTPLDLSAPGAMRIPYTLVAGSIFDFASTASAQVPTTPYRCSAGHQIERFVLTFPAEVSITSVPKGTKIETPLVRYSSSYTINGQRIEAVRDYQSLFPAPSCNAEQFRAVADAKRQIARDVAAQIFFAPR